MSMIIKKRIEECFKISDVVIRSVIEGVRRVDDKIVLCKGRGVNDGRIEMVNGDRIRNKKVFKMKESSCKFSTTNKEVKKVKDIKKKRMPKSVYMDVQSTTPVDPRVLDSMLLYFTHEFGNPHSRTHSYGWRSEKAVNDAREQVASLISADPKEIIFTSGATESNNMAIKGIANFYKGNVNKGEGGKSKRIKNHLITTQIEHKCVLESFRYLETLGFEVTYLPVNKDGILEGETLRKAIKPETSIVSVIALNNEIGVIQNLEEIGKICRENGVIFHTDASQAVGKIPIDVNEMNIDVLSMSSHKIYGPKGVGAIYIRRKPRVRMQPMISGGGQERGLRSGTVPTPLVVGLGMACKIAKEEMERDSRKISELSEKLISGIKSRVPEIQINGSTSKKNGYPGAINISFNGVEGESLMMAAKDIAVSSGSACTSASLEPSYVLRALSVGDDLAHSSIRFGIGRFTTENDVERTIDEVSDSVAKLRNLSPLWEMMEQGIDLKTIKWSS